MSKIFKLRDKRTGEYYSKNSAKFTREGTKFGNVPTARKYLREALSYMVNRRTPYVNTNPYTEEDFEIVEFRIQEIGVVI